MASSDDAAAAEAIGATNQPRASQPGVAGDQAAGGGQRRRQRNQEVQEVVDELAQETKRVTLLEREEEQLKGRPHVSRLLFVFGIADDPKTQKAVEQEFATWRDRAEGSKDLTGVLLFLGHAAISLLEGPSELLFKAVEVFHGLTLEVHAAPEVPSAPADMKVAAKLAAKPEAAAQAPTPRPALISAIRVLYFTELHGVRTSKGWCSFANAVKLQGGGPGNLEEGAVTEPVFLLYKKMLLLCLKVSESAGDDASSDFLQGQYRKSIDMMPPPEDVLILLTKQGADNFLSFPEFQKVFMKPFQLVLNSELLWPMAPALSY